MPEHHEGFSPSQQESSSSMDEEYKQHREAIQQKLGRFKQFQQVSIETGSGQRESNWMVVGYNLDKNKVVLMETGKRGDETTMQRFVKMEDLERWNPA